MPDSVGGTPLEAAARAMTGGMNWDLLSDESQNEFREWARAALTAAIDALPTDALRRTDCPPSEYERIVDSASSIGDAATQLFDRDRAALRRALGLEGDQG